jgi:hypothetical protein
VEEWKLGLAELIRADTAARVGAGVPEEPAIVATGVVVRVSTTGPRYTRFAFFFLAGALSGSGDRARVWE